MRFLVLGDPVAHSLSPVIHNAAFAAAGVDATYGYRTVDEQGMADAMVELRSGALSGANVTMPHKQLAAEFCDALDPLARRAGAVNTLIPTHDGVIGANTDIAGLRVATQWNHLPVEAPLLILGAGGAARAALLAFEEREVLVSARRPGAADAAIAIVGTRARSVVWGQGVDGAVLINATPIGMDGVAEEVPKALIDGMVGVVDLVYVHGETQLVAAARRRDLPRAPGIDVLVAQAAEAFTLWTGIEAPIGVMRAAALESAQA